MNALAIVSIILGFLIIATRGPLIFAPQGTLRVYLRVIKSPAQIRALACVLALMGLAALRGAAGSEGTLSTAIEVIGVWLLAGSVFLLLLPAIYQRFARSILDALDSTALRALGLVGVGVGALFVYFGAAAA